MRARSCLAASMSATEMFEKALFLNCCIEMALAIRLGMFEFILSDLKVKLYSGNLNTDQLDIGNMWISNLLKFKFQTVWYSNGRSMCVVPHTRPTIRIPDQYILDNSLIQHPIFSTIQIRTKLIQYCLKECQTKQFKLLGITPVPTYFFSISLCPTIIRLFNLI